MLRYFAKCAKRVFVTETEKSDVPDKRQRDGISGEGSVVVAIYRRGDISECHYWWGAISVTVAAVDNKQLSAPTVAVMQPGRSSEIVGQ